MYLKRPTPRPFIIRLSKDKGSLESSKKEQLITYRGFSVKLSVDISPEILEARKKWADIFKVLREKNIN